jgi:hypothetical protein
MRYLILLILLSITGCTTTGQHFTEYYPDGSVKHKLNIRHWTAFTDTATAEFSTETQMEEFIFNLDAKGLKMTVNTNALKAVVEGAVEGAMKFKGF